MSSRTSAGPKHKRPKPKRINTLASLFTQGRYAEAATTAHAITLRYPHHGFGWKILGAAQKQMGQAAEALAALQKAVALSPSDVDIHYILGVTFYDLGRPHEAEASYQRAIQLKPDHTDAHNNLGNTLKALNRLEEAEASYQRALQLRPNYSEAHYNLGTLLYEQGRLDEAEASYRQALWIKPDYAKAHSNLGVTLKALARLTEAEESYRRALQINPGSAEAYNNLGNILTSLDRLSEAEESYQRARQINPDYPDLYNNLGVVYQSMGRLDEAEVCYRRALQMKPDWAETYSNLLFLHSYTLGHGSSDYLTEARNFDQKVSAKVTSRFVQWSCPSKPVRLRVGLLSGGLLNHPVGYFLESLLAQLDPSSIELIAYVTNPKVDDLTTRIKPRFVAWKPIFGKSDEAAARMIHGDGIHVLIDIDGHTAYNRLPVFAWKPAPVQVTWLGYFASTGMQAMDYIIADPWTLPDNQEANFTEKAWRLPETRLCFTVPDTKVDVTPLPAQSNHYITFGSFNYLTKINDAVVSLWARVLASVPNSRLFLKAKQLNESSLRQAIVKRFAAHGIAADRLILEGPSPRAEYLAAYSRMDIALDPFPYTGGTTTAEALWMGVPVLTMAGTSFLSRQGVSLLMNAGLSDWIAEDGDDYVTRAVAHAGDLDRLAGLRQALRPQVVSSSIFDASRFAHHFEEAMWEMWNASAWNHHMAMNTED